MTESPAPRKILVAVDPAQDELHALNRVILSTEMYKQQPGSPRPFLHVLLSVDVENTDTSVDNPNLYRDNHWFSGTVLKPLQQSGLEFDVTMCWSTDWYGSLLKMAKERQVDLLVLPVTRKFSPRDRILNRSGACSAPPPHRYWWCARGPSRAGRTCWRQSTCSHISPSTSASTT